RKRLHFLELLTDFELSRSGMQCRDIQNQMESKGSSWKRHKGPDPTRSSGRHPNPADNIQRVSLPEFRVHAPEKASQTGPVVPLFLGNTGNHFPGLPG